MVKVGGNDPKKLSIHILSRPDNFTLQYVHKRNKTVSTKYLYKIVYSIVLCNIQD